MNTDTINPEDDCSNISYNSNKNADIDPDQELQTPSESKPPATPQPGGRKRVDTPIRVRDMINLYNFATQKNQELEMAKSLYFGSMSKSEEDQRTDLEGGSSLCNVSLSEDKEKENEGNLRVTKESALFQSRNDELTADPCAVQASYQSKTTIRHTNQGVRIIIDIFFDKKDSEIDIVGSRVETDIPESRILSDFQQHSLDMKNQELKPGIQDGPSTPKST
ncbi:uncharacterized protein LOC6537048 [Drosophila yakuba]|uniref:Uncharacterized protein n=1 Tax=Drosophila yakuba TaxID=7245 RepID=B4PR03_DROYA|nr:uncharacterized protein LOC6537048 [Drosophila yakuba]EDW97325.1 uncharacterized protein Dyak_GE26317 [Drosophila yakuba]